ncbi:O-methyltransferase [Calorimonas adulescens]|jgi:O-methyltransferase.|uniref:tRNA 5-hydroxyuridine methyltransferase n=1 Tax=Calorimonas adulescens TaxID=2606906 RepID=A0A5D8QHX0_9THEO|nr:O-methyltransferase [Calorimonas adulescens]TZE83476.1 O-methyltransferase [Calorimonas adulescens]
MIEIDSDIIEYINRVSLMDDDILKDIKGQINGYSPIIRPGVDRFICFMLELKRPKRILEIGAFVGYSSILMASYAPWAEVTSIEVNEKNFVSARANVEKSGLKNIRLIYGDALDVLRFLNEKYDFVFIDASKGHYNEYLDLCLDLISKDGIIIADNVLFGGRIVKEGPVPHKHRTIVMRMRQFIDRIMNDRQLSSCIIPLGDGLAVIRYKGRATDERY